jgi:hypothetical protein
MAGATPKFQNGLRCGGLKVRQEGVCPPTSPIKVGASEVPIPVALAGVDSPMLGTKRSCDTRAQDCLVQPRQHHQGPGTAAVWRNACFALRVHAPNLCTGSAGEHILDYCGPVAAIPRIHAVREPGVSMPGQPRERRRGQLERLKGVEEEPWPAVVRALKAAS